MNLLNSRYAYSNLILDFFFIRLRDTVPNSLSGRLLFYYEKSFTKNVFFFQMMDWILSLQPQQMNSCHRNCKNPKIKSLDCKEKQRYARTCLDDVDFSFQFYLVHVQCSCQIFLKSLTQIIILLIMRNDVSQITMGLLCSQLSTSA